MEKVVRWPQDKLITKYQSKTILYQSHSRALNESDYKNIAQKVKQSVAQCNEEGFCILVNDLQLIGSTLDAYKELEELNQWLNTQKMIAKAIVIERDTLLDTIQTLVPAIKDQKIKTFDAIEDAMLWLKSQLKNQV